MKRSLRLVPLFTNLIALPIPLNLNYRLLNRRHIILCLGTVQKQS